MAPVLKSVKIVLRPSKAAVKSQMAEEWLDDELLDEDDDDELEEECLALATARNADKIKVTNFMEMI